MGNPVKYIDNDVGSCISFDGYDKTFGEGIKIFFDTITDILLSQM